MNLIKKIVAILLSIVFILSVCSIVSATASDVAGIESNTIYYLRNKDTGKYLCTYHNYITSGTNVICSTYSTNNAHKWKLVYASSNTYKIQSMAASDRYLTITTSTGNAYISSHNATFSNQLFTIARITTGKNAGLYRISVSNKDLIDNNSNALFSTVSSDDNDLWSLEKAAKGNASFLCFKYQNGTFLYVFATYFDTSKPSSSFLEKYSAMGYNPAVYLNNSSSNGLLQLKNSDILIFFGHGNKALIAFHNSSGTLTGKIVANSGQGTSSTVFALNNQTANCLANARCVLLIGCSVGSSTSGYNIVDTAFSKGAHFVLAPKNVIYTSDGNAWIKYFNTKLAQGYNIESSIRYANQHQNLGAIYYKGDIYQKITD